MRLCQSMPNTCSNNHIIQIYPNGPRLRFPQVCQRSAAPQDIFFSQAESCCSPSCSEETTTKIWWTLHLERNLCRSDLTRWQMSVIPTNTIKYHINIWCFPWNTIAYFHVLSSCQDLSLDLWLKYPKGKVHNINPTLMVDFHRVV